MHLYTYNFSLRYRPLKFRTIFGYYRDMAGPNKSSTSEWDTAYPPRVMCLKTEFEKSQMACVVYSLQP